MLLSMETNSTMSSAITSDLIPVLSEMMACWMSTLAFSKPEGLNASQQWHQNISLASNLLEKKYNEYSIKICV
jgi:hypothetical protein